ncbi:MAG: nuclear transport factor 2 family protein [Chloroflexi bacterium]|nr:nuclear transport factor 2 family protein [Chloroflexota bacterium]MCI0576967.1 nuclear transport factor 2 family protein [Chloroflexota bacterium]MCI0649363.1 nuclear transport factor 2 family protein [Chloroflexota bacterium]MCI0729782.1 nuclear transport factor 2 family protein [Chloroflexota bacterium]
MHPNEQLIESFYACFGRRDYAGMLACYAPEVEFSDPIFRLKGKRAGGMWHMLCEGGKDLKITAGDIRAGDTQGQAHWEAWYTFSLTGRKVHNVINAEFRFDDGRIVWHQDRFSFWRWTRMALGPAGLFLGWTPLVQNKVRRTANGNLEKFIAAHPEYQ